MNLEKLKETVNTLEKYRKCIKMDYCDGVCPNCPCNFMPEDVDNSIDTAITVINDVIKNMERLKNGQS